jgi:tripartite-type tricarboxylate transporter receptor subunit TctC
MKKLIIVMALTAFAGSAGVQAQTYPSRSITLVVPFPPGGSTDVAARIMADRMRPLLGQSVIIENVGGAGGSIGVGRVARASPDGYTIDIGQWDTHVGSIIYNLTYDLQKDFEPIGLISVNPQLMVGKKALPADDLKGLVAWMNANPGKITFVNQNAAAQVTGILFEQATGHKVQFIPYRGAGPAMQDLMAGRIDFTCEQISTAFPQIEAGTVKGIAILGLDRVPVMPKLPTAHEQGLFEFDCSAWSALAFPKGTPQAIVRRLAQAASKALDTPSVRERLEAVGVTIVPPERQSPEYLARFIPHEIEKWTAPIKASGVQMD